MKRILFAVIFLLFPALSFSQTESSLDISGYYKNILILTKSLYSKEDIFADTSRLRLEFKKEIKPWQFYLTIDNEAIANDFSNTSDFKFIRSKQQDNLTAIDLDKVSVDNEHLYLKHSVYRAYLKYYSPKFQAVIGKQSIDWGRMRFYSPVDLFNSLAATELEPDERVGIDALNLNFSSSDFSGLNVVLAPAKNSGEASFGAKLSRKISTYDCAFMFADIRKNKVLGFLFDGYIKEAGFRGEFTYTLQDDKRNFPRVSLGIDYNFFGRLYLLIEQFFNGGADDNDTTALSSSYGESRKILSLKKHLSGININYELTPLVKLDSFTVYDWEGKSVFVSPQIRYNICQDFDLSIGVQLFFGRTNSEFGDYNHLYFFEAKKYF
ncbi:MAG: hypothetical protein Q8L26_06110 [Candidatus Omnitrophota bacterium]|nr:hypothetical protein [Candidatus Omnitrophota bacterium]